jgi:hypothetical protein
MRAVAAKGLAAWPLRAVVSLVSCGTPPRKALIELLRIACASEVVLTSSEHSDTVPYMERSVCYLDREL